MTSISPIDALHISSHLNASLISLVPRSTGAESGEGEGEVGVGMDGVMAAAADGRFQSLQGRRRVVGAA